jgi:hypothetical protein
MGAKRESLIGLDAALSSVAGRIIEEHSRKSADQKMALQDVMHRIDTAIAGETRLRMEAFGASSKELERAAEKTFMAAEVAVEGLSSRLINAGASTCRRPSERLLKASEGLTRARPTVQSAALKLTDLVTRLQQAGTHMIASRTERLRDQAGRLAVQRPQVVERVRFIAGSLAQDAGRLAAAIGAISFDAIGELKGYAAEAVRRLGGASKFFKPERAGTADVDRRSQPVEPSGSKQDAITFAPEAALETHPEHVAQRLLHQLDLIPYALQRERGLCFLDVERLPERLRSAAADVGHLPMVREWLDKADANLQTAFAKRLAGADPVVHLQDGKLVAIRSKLSPGLAAVADDMLSHDDHIRRLANKAVRRWSGRVVPEDRAQLGHPSLSTRAASASMAQAPAEKATTDEQPSQVDLFIEAAAEGALGSLKGPGRD